MRRTELLHRGLALVLALSATAAMGQEALPGFELERLELNPGAEGSLLVGLGELLPAGNFRTTVVAHYAHAPLLLEQDGETFQIVGGRATAHVAAAYALNDWLQVMLQVPVVFQTTGDLTDTGYLAPASSGLGTPTAAVRVAPLAQDDQGGIDLALELGAGLPVGSSQTLARDAGMLRLAPKVMVGRHFGFIRAGLEVGFVRRLRQRITQTSTVAQDQIGNELRLGAAIATTGRRLRWEMNVRGMVPLTSQPGSAELLPGARYLVNPSLELFALAGVGVGSAPGTPLFRLMVGGAYGSVTPRRGPGESSVNCEKGLPHTLEECPEMDEDEDGVRNIKDQCPLVPGDVERDGCTRKDSDGDAIEDKLDACPFDFGPPEEKGCPIPDDDKDGVRNEEDRCPDKFGPKKTEGCPVPDDDGDGIDNDQDECPKLAGPEERKGCPENDTDRDGIPNREDVCAKEAGVEASYGCPAHVSPPLAIEPDRLRLLRNNKVFFEPSLTQVRLKPISYELLDWVARVIEEHPEFPLVVVGGHTDDRGFPEANRQLSQTQAEVVRQYLIKKGIAPERLKAVGYGQERPIDTNVTAIGRENNRRIEFILVNSEQGKTESPRR